MLKTWNSKSGHPYWPRKKRQSVRLSYFNTANMGDYREAVVAFLRGINSKPDITAHRHQGSLKYGLGLNIEQTLPANFRAFARAGWNEGRHESFAYTEANNTGSVGIDLAGEQW